MKTTRPYTANRLIVCIAFAAGCRSAGSMDDPGADKADKRVEP
jgi:hypothetical protein